MRPLWTTLLCLALTPGLALAWSGEEVTIDGVLHVKNPASPAESASPLPLTEVWRRGGEDDDVMFGVTGRILVDPDGLTYVLDRQLNEIQVFDPDGEWLRTIGREGEGPGEFQNAADMFFTPGGYIGVSQMFPGKIVQLAGDGTPQDNFPMTTTEGFMALQRGRTAGSNLVVAGSKSGFSEGAMSRESFLAALDSDGKEVVRYHEAFGKVDFAKLNFQEIELDGFVRNWNVTSDGKIVASVTWDEYSMQVWNPDGTLERVIHREYTPTVRTDEEKEDARSNFGININGRQAEIEVSDVDRCISTIYSRPDGSIWVLSDQGASDQEEGILATLDEFDAQGRFTRQVQLPAAGNLDDDGLFILEDRVFVILGFADAARTMGPQEDEEEEDLDYVEPLTVVCYQIGS